ncbi:MAG: sulfite exporter TauE/SafE family protein [bacterium]|nr:sulfite exporter TauE/SafE family protein [bacterium]
MILWTECLKIFITGLTAGAGPCLLSCAPVLLPLLTVTAKNEQHGIKTTILFVLGRLAAYLFLGFLAGWSIRWLDKFDPAAPLPAVIRVGAAGFIIMLGALIIIGRGISFHSCDRFIKYFIDKNHKSMFILGILIGFAPCLPLLGILTYIAIKAATPWQGLVYAGCFGIGNILIILLLGVFSSVLLVRYRQSIGRGQKILGQACGLFLILWGILLTFKK